MGILKTISIAGISALSLGLTACQKSEQNNSAAHNNIENPVQTLSMGFQKSALNLLVVRDQKLLEQQFPNAKIEWKEFPAGPQMLEALAVGAVDFGYVGNMPPIFAQAANKELNYIGFEKYPNDSLAVVIKNNSNIQNIEALKGKRVAVQKGSSAHELLSKVLLKANLSWSDIEPIWLPPADARAAFDKGSVDAWVIWDPFLAAAELEGQAKHLISGRDFPETYSFYIGNPKFIQAHPDAPEKIIKSLNEADQWIVKNVNIATQTYAQNTGLKVEIAQKSIDRRLKPSPINVLTPEVIQAQQNIADLLQNLKLIPNHIEIKNVVWSPNSTH
jgi:sulfonate transport system substrate-binding protein